MFSAARGLTVVKRVKRCQKVLPMYSILEDNCSEPPGFTLDSGAVGFYSWGSRVQCSKSILPSGQIIHDAMKYIH